MTSSKTFSIFNNISVFALLVFGVPNQPTNQHQATKHTTQNQTNQHQPNKTKQNQTATGRIGGCACSVEGKNEREGLRGKEGARKQGAGKKTTGGAYGSTHFAFVSMGHWISSPNSPLAVASVATRASRACLTALRSAEPTCDASRPTTASKYDAPNLRSSVDSTPFGIMMGFCAKERERSRERGQERSRERERERDRERQRQREVKGSKRERVCAFVCAFLFLCFVLLCFCVFFLFVFVFVWHLYNSQICLGDSSVSSCGSSLASAIVSP